MVLKAVVVLFSQNGLDGHAAAISLKSLLEGDAYNEMRSILYIPGSLDLDLSCTKIVVS